ncbi:MAG TPA: PilN domain-containing protein [Candidatus Acidoferrales bacterium]|nr:PilN domain-containing protein [Candidatus Acidoferrales bacterium]
MIRFNFLKSPETPFLERLRDVEFTAQTRHALVGLAMACSLVIFADAIEQARLLHAHATATAVADRYATDEQEMAGLRTSEETVRKLSALAASVHTVQNSGTLRAAEFAEIGDRLPEHLWLTSIHQDADGLLIDGGAQSYALIGEAIGSLEHARTVGDPILVSSGTIDVAHPGEVDYEVHLQEHLQ